MRNPTIEAVENGLQRRKQLPGVAPQNILKRMQELHVPNASITMIVDGVARSRDYDSGAQTASDRSEDGPAPVFQAGSISKTINAVLAMKLLVEAGKIAIDEDLTDKLKTMGIHNTTGKPITLAQLLSHTGGINVHGFAGYPANSKRIPSTAQILAGNAELKGKGNPPEAKDTHTPNTGPIEVVGEPGKQYAYSGGGTTIVQKLIEDAYPGETYASLAQTHIFNPLGMTQSSFEFKVPGTTGAEVQKGRDRNGDEIPGGWRMIPESAAGGLWTTSSDLAKFAIAIYQMSLGNTDNSILKQETIQQMLVKQPNATFGTNSSFGLGFEIYGEGDAVSFGHDGGTIGYSADYIFFPRMKMGAVILTNSEKGGNDLIEEIYCSIAENYDLTIKKSEIFIQLPDASLQKCVGEFSTEDGKIFTAKVVDGQLQLTLPHVDHKEHAELSFVPLSETTFFCVESQCQVTFDADYNAITMNGMHSKRVDLLNLNAPTFQEFLDNYSAYFSTLDSDEQKTHLANAFWKYIDTIKMPVVELADDGSYQVHFLYRKSKEELKDNDLYVQSDFHGCDSTLNSQKLNHVGNTDVMCCTTSIKKSEFENALIAYHFIEAPHTYQNKNFKEIEAMSESDRTVDFNNHNNWIADSHRKHSEALNEKESLFCVNEGNDLSPWRQAGTMKWPTFEDVLLDERLIHFRHKSKDEIIQIRPHRDGEIIHDSVDLGKDLHSVQILIPAGSVEDVKKIVIVNDGFAYLLSDGVNRLQKMADQEKCAFIFISPGMGLGDPKTNPVSGIRGIEYHHGIDKYNDFVLNKLLPELHKQKIIPENHPTNMTIVGASTSGTAALQTGLTHPDRFSHVIAHSPAPISREIIDSISRAAPLAHFTKDEFITLQQIVFLEQRNSSAGLPELFYKVQSISDFNDNYKNASLTIKEIQLLKEFLHKSDRDDLIEKILKAEKTQKTPIIDLEYGKFEGPTHTRAYDYLGQAYDLLAYGRTLEQQLSIEMQVGMHGHQQEPWMHDLAARSLPAMFAQQTASVVSERDHVSAAVMPQLGLIAQHTTASQSVVDSAQKGDDANQQLISPENKLG